MTRVAVIGGGYAGTAFAVHLGRVSPRPLEIVVVEPREQVGGGLAHSAVDRDHRLNAPDVIHPLYPEDPMHFRRWLEASGRLREDPEALYADGRLYPRRRDFGAYVSAEFGAHAVANPSGSRLSHRRGAAVRIRKRHGTFRIDTNDGAVLEAERCVIAVGHEPASAALPGLPPASADDRLIEDPFAPDAMRSVDDAAEVLILGTGLTAADAVASLLGQGHRGRITCLSRRGVRPQDQSPATMKGSIWEHLGTSPPAFVAKHGLPRTLRALVAIVREDARDRLARGEPWHGAIDDVRDAAGEIWRALPVADKDRFLRHLKPYYDGLRFRIPPQTRDILRKAEGTGRLCFEKGKVVHVEPRADGLAVTTRPRGEQTTRTRLFGAIVSCRGFATRVEHSRNPFVRSCLEEGLVRESDMGRGFEADEACRALSASGTVDPDLYVIGEMALDRFGETPAAIFILRQILRMLPDFVAARPPARRASALPSASAAGADDRGAL